jgi:hypothetical protein
MNKKNIENLKKDLCQLRWRYSGENLQDFSLLNFTLFLTEKPIKTNLINIVVILRRIYYNENEIKKEFIEIANNLINSINTKTNYNRYYDSIISI